MRKIVSLIIICAYAFGLGITNPENPFVVSIKLDVEHTHLETHKANQVNHPHHHNLADNREHTNTQNNDHNEDNSNGNDDVSSDANNTDEQKQPIHHTHEISVAIGSSHIILSSPINLISMAIPTEMTRPSIYKTTPLKDLTLRSIYRPPIA
jgi:hypothetical protein